MKRGEDSMTEIRCHWIPTEVEQGVPFEFSQSVAALVSQVPRRPEVYRWSFFKKDILVKAYIGETEDLKVRIRDNLNPGPSQETNKRMNAEVKKGIQSGLTIRLDVLRIEPVRLNQVNICNEN